MSPGSVPGAISEEVVPRRTSPPARSSDRTSAAPVAVFDLDHTLSRRDTFLAWLLGFLARHPERWPRSLPLPAAVLWHKVGQRDNHWLKRTFLRAIVGGLSPGNRPATGAVGHPHPPGTAARGGSPPLGRWTETFVAGLLARGLWPRGLDTIERHRAAGDRLVLVSASPDLYVEPLAAALGFELALCTRLAVGPDGRLTGEFDGENCYGPAKLLRLDAVLGPPSPGARLTVYTDHHTDLDLLRRATHPVAVNPTPLLRRQALEAGITIEDWRG